MRPALLLMLAFPMLVGLAGAGLLILEGQAQQRRVANRLHRVSPAAAPAARHAPIAGAAAGTIGSLERLAGLLGCDWPRRRFYPAPWWGVVAGSIAAGYAAALLLEDLLGRASIAAWPLVALVSSRMIFGTWGAKRRGRLLEQFPDALGMIVRTVRVGVPVAEGIRLVGREAEEPTRTEFRRLAEELAIGVSLGQAVRSLAARTGMAEYGFFATTIVLQAQTGGGLGEALETLADVVRKRVALRARGYALSSEARTSAMVLSALPFLAGGTMLLLTPDYMGPLFTTKIGHKMLTVAAISLIVGTLSMRSLIRKTLS